MSAWALVGLVVVMVVVAGLALLLTRRREPRAPDLPQGEAAPVGAATRRTVADMVRERQEAARSAAGHGFPAPPAIGASAEDASGSVATEERAAGSDGAGADGPAGTAEDSPESPEAAPGSPAEGTAGSTSGSPPGSTADGSPGAAEGAPESDGDGSSGSDAGGSAVGAEDSGEAEGEARVEHPRPGMMPVDAGPVGPPWTRGFVDGVPVEAPPRARTGQEGRVRTQPERRSPVDPDLVARVTSVRPLGPLDRSGNPVRAGIVSPAVADAVARAEARRHRPGPVTHEPPAEECTPEVSAGQEPSAPHPIPQGPAGHEPTLQEPSPDVVPGPRPASQEESQARGLPRAEAPQAPDASGDGRGGPVAATGAGGEFRPQAGPEPRPVLSIVRDTPGPRLADPSTSDDLTVGTPPASPRDRAGTLDVVSSPTSTAEPGRAPTSRTTEPVRDATPEPAAGADPGQRDASPGVHPPRRLRRLPSPDVRAAAKAAEHAAVDLALLRTLGFADPNPRPGAAPVVAMSSEDEQEADEPVDETLAVPVAFRVRNRDGAPVAGTTVALLDARGRQTAQANGDAQGAGTVVAPRPGSYVLLTAAGGHQPGVAAVTVADTPGVPVEVQLVRSGSITGAVTGPAGPLAAAKVTVLQDGEVVGSAETAADGAYHLADLASGDYAVTVSAPGHDPATVTIRLAEEQHVRCDVPLAAVATAPSRR